MFSSTARQIQRAASLRADVRSAVVRPSGGLWEREEPGALHTQHSERLLLFLQVGAPSPRTFIICDVVVLSLPLNVAVRI